MIDRDLITTLFIWHPVLHIQEETNGVRTVGQCCDFRKEISEQRDPFDGDFLVESLRKAKSQIGLVLDG